MAKIVLKLAGAGDDFTKALGISDEKVKAALSSLAGAFKTSPDIDKARSAGSAALVSMAENERRQREHQSLVLDTGETAPKPKPLPLINGKIPRSDDGFSLLANALWLSDLHGRMDEMQRVLNAKPIDVFLREYSKSDPFERMLCAHAIYDSRLKISRRIALCEIDSVKPNVESMSLKLYIGGIRALVKSGANIAQLRFVDLNLTADELREYGLNPSPTEKRTPIAKQSPSEFTKALKRLVVDYFERVDGSAEPSNPNDEVPKAVKKRRHENKIVEFLGGFYRDNPNMRISKKDANEALKSKLRIGKRAFDRIWKRFNEDRESKSGVIPCAEALSSNDLENFYQKNAAKYGLNN